MTDEIARLRAEISRLFAAAERTRAETERRRIALSAQLDQTMALVRDARDRADAIRESRERTQPMAHLTSKSKWITGQIIRFLEAEAPLPASTTHIVDQLCLRHEYPTVLRLLNRLSGIGEVEKWPSGGEHRSCYWRRL